MKKSFYISLLCLSLCLLIYGCSDGYYIKVADRYIERGEYERAVKNLDRVLSNNPNSYDALLNKGICISELGNNIGAIDYFSKAASISPDNPLVYYNKAESYMRLERYAEALDDYNEALKLVVGNPNDYLSITPTTNDFVTVATIDLYLLYADRAVAYYFLGRTKLAFQDLNLCIEKSQQLAQCYYWRGHIYLDNKMKEEGCEDLRKAVDMGYENAKTSYRNLCDCTQ